MAITFPITGVAPGIGGRDAGFTLGTAPAENDILVAYVSTNSAGVHSDVTGWTNVVSSNFYISLSDSTMAAAMVYHRVTAAEAAASTVTWTLTNFWAGNENGRIAVAVLRGVATTGELVGSASGSDINLVDGTIPSVTPTADSTVIAGFSQDGTGTRTSAPDGYTDIAGNTGTFQHVYIYRRTTDATANTATGTAAANTASNDEYISIVACFKPAQAAAPPLTYGIKLNQAVNRAAVI